MEEHAMECKGCGKTHFGQFCDACGQKVITERFTFRKIFDNLITAVFNVDRGILHTFKELTFRPGTVADDYLNGKTKAYFNPFSFLIVAITITVIVGQATGIYEAQLAELNESNFEGKSEEYIELQKNLQYYMGRLLNLLIFTSLPGIAIFSYLVFRKKGFLLAEHFVVNCFYYGYILFITLLFVPLQMIFSSALFDMGMGMVVATIYLSWAYKDWLKYSTFGAIIRASIIYTFGFLIVMLFFVTIGILAAIIYKMNS